MRKSSIVVAALLGVGLLASAGRVEAAAGTCRGAILRAATNYGQTRFKVLQRCEDRIVRGHLPPSTDCAGGPGDQTRLARAAARMRTDREQLRGYNRFCAATDTGGRRRYAGVRRVFSDVSDFEASGCSGDLADCDDVAGCLICIAQSGRPGIDLYYDALIPTDARGHRTLDRCQRAIGKRAVKFATTKERVLARCWKAVNGGNAVPPCPVPGDAKALLAIARAERGSQRAVQSLRRCRRAMRRRGHDDERTELRRRLGDRGERRRRRRHPRRRSVSRRTATRCGAGRRELRRHRHHAR